MDTSDLLRQLRGEIAQKTSERDRLVEKITALGDDVHELSSEQELLLALLNRFNEKASAPPGDDAHEARDEAQLDPRKALRVTWPVGPHYRKAVKAKKLQAWARYKLMSADWYLTTLRQISEQESTLDRA